MNAPEILVTGGTGTLGSRVVECLHSTGIRPRVLSRSNRPGTFGGDLLTGEGLVEAVRGADTVIHCASSPLRKARRTDVGGTERLLEAAAREGVSHLVYISIVGIDRAISYPYYRIKLETERLVERSPIPYTILKSTQFHGFVLRLLESLARLPVMPVPRGFLLQPIDVGEVANRLVELALSGPSGRVPEIGGPEVMTTSELSRSYLREIGSGRRLLEVPMPGRTARVFREGALTLPGHTYGSITWEEFLRGQQSAASYQHGISE